MSGTNPTRPYSKSKELVEAEDDARRRSEGTWIDYDGNIREQILVIRLETLLATVFEVGLVFAVQVAIQNVSGDLRCHDGVPQIWRWISRLIKNTGRQEWVSKSFMSSARD